MIGLLALAAATGASQSNADLRGTAGVCIRWDRPAHVADAVVVVSSGNPKLDAALPDTIRAMKEWPAPDAYDGGWVGINFAVAGDPGNDRPLPDCSQYRLPKP
jgi:TonB family protein